MVIQEQGLEELLDRGGIFTVFAPINAAFEEDMVSGRVAEKLHSVHTYYNLLQSTFDEATTILAHIIPAEVTSMVSTPSIYVTLAGHVVEITPSRNYTIVGSSDSAGIIVSDLIAFNGLINIMEDVSVIPESARPFNISNVRGCHHHYVIVRMLTYRMIVHGILFHHGTDCHSSALSFRYITANLAYSVNYYYVCCSGDKHDFGFWIRQYHCTGTN